MLRRPLKITAAHLMFAVVLVCSSAFAQEGPDLQELTETGQKTLERIQERSSRWKVEFQLSNGNQIEVDNIDSPTRRRMTVTIIDGNERIKNTEIIARDGLWYVSDAGQQYKCYPYEAPLSIPIFYKFLARIELQVYVDASQGAGTFERMDGDVAVFRTPLTEAMRQQLAPVYEQLLNLQSISPNPKPGQEEKLMLMEDVLNNGTEIRINTKTGIIEKAGAIGKEFRVLNFHWLRRAVPGAFDIDRVQWEDRTTDIANNDEEWRDVILINQFPAWRPSMNRGETETVMLNLKTGATRRVPFYYGQVGNACLSSDHRYFYANGLSPLDGCLGVYEIDLWTHEHYILGSEELQIGVSLFPQLSPDGATVAVQHVEFESGPLQSRMHLIDVASGESVPIGETHDMSHARWLPQSDGLILATREYANLQATPISYICQMDLDGKVTRLRKGAQPVVLGNTGRILYEGEDDLWYTCDMKGEDPQKVRDGLPKFGSPSTSADGKRVLWMKFGGKEGPRPHLLELESGEMKPLDVGMGLWEKPHW